MNIEFILGLLVSNGSFQICPMNKKNLDALHYCIVCKFELNKHNLIMLSKLNSIVGYGHVKVAKHYVLWKIDHHSQIYKFIESIFRTNLIKYVFVLRYKIQMYKMKYCLENKVTYSQYKYMLKYRKDGSDLFYDVLSRNAYIKPDFELLDYTKIASVLCGFIEAEGCFSIHKNGNMSFSICQKDTYEIIQYIKELFNIPNQIKVHTKAVSSFHSSSSYSIETYNKIALKRIITFIDTGNIDNSRANNAGYNPALGRYNCQTAIINHTKIWPSLQGNKLLSYQNFKQYYNIKHNY